MLTLPWIVCCLKYIGPSSFEILRFQITEIHWNLLKSYPTLLRSDWRRSCQDSWRCLGDYGAGCGCQGFMKVGHFVRVCWGVRFNFSEGSPDVSLCLEGFAMISGESSGFNLWQADSLYWGRLPWFEIVSDCAVGLHFAIYAYFWSFLPNLQI